MPPRRVRAHQRKLHFALSSAIPSCRRLIKLSRRERPSGSLPAFAWGDVALRLNPYPLHYRTAFAFSTILCPHRQQHSLRSACPEGQRYGFTVFRLSNKSKVRPCLFAGGYLIRVCLLSRDTSKPRTILVQACQHLWLVCVCGVYQQFTYVGHTTQPSTVSALMLADNASTSRFPRNRRIRLHCPGSFTHNCCQSCICQ